MTPQIVDAHSDLLLELSFAEQRDGEANPLSARWLPQIESGGVVLQVCAVSLLPGHPPEDGLHEALRLVRAFHRGVDQNRDRVFAVQTVEDLDRLGAGHTGLLLSLEGADFLGDDPSLIDVFARLGVRMTALTWNDANAFAGGCATDIGLTALGGRLVDRIVELGMLVDLAHASDRTFWEVHARVPPGSMLVSHAACRAVYDHPRNLSDAQLRALAERGGVLGLMLHPFALHATRTDIDCVLTHVDHAVDVAGIEHVGLGADFTRQVFRALGISSFAALGTDVPADTALDRLGGPEDYPVLIDALRAHGYGEDDLAALLGGNLLRLLRGRLPPAG